MPDASPGPVSAPWSRGDPTMTAPQMMALDLALAELEVPPPDPGRWAWQLAGVARQMRAVIGRHRHLVPSSVGFLPGGGRAVGYYERVTGHPAGRRPAGQPVRRRALSVVGHRERLLAGGDTNGGTGALRPGPATRDEPVLRFAARRPLPEPGRCGGRVRQDRLRRALRAADQHLHQRAGRTAKAVMTGFDTSQHRHATPRARRQR